MSFHNDFDEDSGVISEINMTPLVDVMLVLLIIFMITVPVLTHSIPLELPQVSHQPSQTKPDTVTLAVTADGSVYWNRDKLSRADLTHRLQQAALQTPQPSFQLKGDRTVAYEHVVSTLAAVQQAGITQLGFLTEPGA
ncbi:MAG: biopolymer transporter ExbD [Rheinheimera sp.]|nr:biopolymer transporter ExbD [Rheinheimera sp.]